MGLNGSHLGSLCGALEALSQLRYCWCYLLSHSESPADMADSFRTLLCWMGVSVAHQDG